MTHMGETMRTTADRPIRWSNADRVVLVGLTPVVMPKEKR